MGNKSHSFAHNIEIPVYPSQNNYWGLPHTDMPVVSVGVYAMPCGVHGLECIADKGFHRFYNNT